MKEKYLLIKVPKEQEGCMNCGFCFVLGETDCYNSSKAKNSCPIHNGVEVEEVKVDLFGGEFQGIESIKTGHTYFDPKLFAVKHKEGK